MSQPQEFDQTVIIPIYEAPGLPPKPPARRKRLATFSPGMVFGEMAVLDAEEKELQRWGVPPGANLLVEDGHKVLICEHAGRDLAIAFDTLLVAVGRVANTAGYGLEELGIPVTQARTAGSDSPSVNASSITPIISSESALRASGRFSVRVAMRSCTL